MRVLDEKMSVQLKSFYMQKLGNEPSDYEDSFYYDLNKGKFAIADGASECCFAKIWATLLTESFVKSDLSLFSFKNFSSDVWRKVSHGFLSIAQKEWVNKINWENLKWNVFEKAKKGAFASFLGLEIRKKRFKERYSYKWRAIAVGDCCLLRVKSQKLVDSFPVTDSANFGSMPPMLSSISSSKALNEAKVYGKLGEIESGDMMILATDGITKWIMQESKINKQIFRDLVSLESSELNSYFERLIESGKMKNDDITVIILSL
ncbi:MAG: hypothetical protein QW270_03670 [Candidatus Bathyarchaeia archaeon]